MAIDIETLSKRLEAFKAVPGYAHASLVVTPLTREEIKALREGLTLLRIWRSREMRVGVAIRKPGKVRKVRL